MWTQRGGEERGAARLLRSRRCFRASASARHDAASEPPPQHGLVLLRFLIERGHRQGSERGARQGGARSKYGGASEAHSVAIKRHYLRASQGVPPFRQSAQIEQGTCAPASSRKGRSTPDQAQPHVAGSQKRPE